MMIKYNIISVIVASILLLLTSSFCNAIDCTGPEDFVLGLSKDNKISGSYYNCTYGYYAEVPRNVVAYVDSGPSPQHGFAIVIPTSNSGYVWVNGEYNSLEYRNLSEIVKDQILAIQRKGNVILLKYETNTKINGISAKRIKIKYKCNNKYIIDEQIILLDAERQLIYTLGLTSKALNYREYVLILDRIAKTFKMRPIC